MSQDKKFDQLKKKWYAKLEKSGFKDIESDEDNLKSWTLSRFVSTRNNGLSLDEVLQTQDHKTTYYRAAGHFLHGYKFTSDIDKFIWSHHADGASVRTIATLLKTVRVKMAATQVMERIATLRKLMFLGHGNQDE